MTIGETRQQADDRRDGQCERHNLMNLLGNRFFIDEFTTIKDPRTTDEILSRKPKCCMPGWKPQKFPKPKPIDPEIEAYFENQRRDTAKMLGRHRRQCRLRTGREVE